MARRKREVTIADELVDQLLKDYREPEDLLGESGIIEQLTQRLVE
jgi:putative transposase